MATQRTCDKASETPIPIGQPWEPLHNEGGPFAPIVLHQSFLLRSLPSIVEGVLHLEAHGVRQ